MTPLLLQNLEAVFGWIWAASWQASVLAMLVLLAQRMLGARLNPRWRYALWLLVLVRLILPALPESALSLFQFAPPAPAAIIVPVTEPLFVAAPLPAHQADLPPVAPAYPFSFYSLLSVIWLSGAVILLLLTWQVNRRFARQIANSPKITDPELLQLFASAKSELNIRRSIHLIENTQVQSPAIMGLFQPTLLLPARAREKFDTAELRFIFLHELAHLKRGDVIVQGLIALLQIVHWFNPVLWFAFRRMRIDREPATDALVLSRTGESEKERYGLMLIKLLEHFNQRHSLPTLVGILEDKDQFKRRFSLIAKFTRSAYGWSLLGILLIALLAVACLTKSKHLVATNPAQVIEAVKKGDAAALQRLIDQGADPNNIQADGRPLLFLTKNPEVVEILLAHGADANASTKSDDNALAWFCRNAGANSAAIARVLLKHGANPNATSGELATTPIMEARDGDTVDVLVENGADLKAKTKDGRGILAPFIAWSKPSAFDALLRHGVPFDPKTDGPMMLVHAAWLDNTDLMKDLLDRGVDPNVEGLWYTSPIGKKDMMKPMDAAVISGQFAAAKMLLDHGAKADDSMVAALNNRRKKIVEIFWNGGVRNISELCYAVSQGAPIADLQKLLDKGSPADPLQDKTFSPLDIAAQLGNLDAVKLLIEKGANVNKGYVPNAEYPIFSNTPLSMAASEGQDEVIDYLLSHGAKADANALYEAADNSTPYEGEQRTKDHFEKSVQLLLAAGAMKNLTPELQGYVVSAPIETRQGPPNATVLKMLLNAGANPESPMPYMTEHGLKPNTVIGYYREQYQKFKDDPNQASRMSDFKPLLDLLEAADKSTTTTATPTGTLVRVATSPATDTPSDAMIRLYVQVVEIDEDVYQANKQKIDDAVKNSDPKALSDLKSYKLVADPFAIIKSGQQGVIESVRVVPYPVDFGKDSTGKMVGTDFKRQNVGVRLVSRPTFSNGTIDLSAIFELVSLESWKTNSDTTYAPVFHSNRENLKTLFSSGQTLGFEFLDGPQMEPLDPTVTFAYGETPDTTKNPVALRRVFLFLTATAYTKDGKVILPSSSPTSAPVQTAILPDDPYPIPHPPPTSLNQAIMDDQYDTAKALLDKDADVYDMDMPEALSLARNKIVKLLWDHGAHKCSELTYAISQGATAEQVDAMLKNGASVQPPEDEFISPLAVATINENLPVVKLLLEHKADPNWHGRISTPNFTPLQSAISTRNSEMISYLLDHGALLDPRMTHLALTSASYDIPGYPQQKIKALQVVHLLAAHGALEQIDPKDKGALLYQACVYSQNVELVQLLLNHGYSPNDPARYLFNKTTVIESVRRAAAGKDNWPDTPQLKPILALLEKANDKAAVK